MTKTTKRKGVSPAVSKETKRMVTYLFGRDVRTVTPEQTKVFCACWNVLRLIRTLPTNVDEARDTLRITEQIMAFENGDRWKYTAKEYGQYLKGKNPHGLKAVRMPAKRGSKA
jgi:hypothetical protein